RSRPQAGTTLEGTERMSLSDRIAQARLDRISESQPIGGMTQSPSSAGPITNRQRRAARLDPFAELKRTVHQALLESLGPKLYDSRLTAADRSRVSREIAEDILGYGPVEPYLRDTEITEIMVNGADQIFVERNGR